MQIQRTRFQVLSVALLALGMNLRAEEPAAPRKKEAASSAAPKVSLSAKLLSPKAIASTTIFELVAQNVTLQPGGSQQFYTQSDYTGVDKVALGFYAATDQDLSATNYLVWWAIPGASSYVVGNYVPGNTFPFLNTGGVQLATFGNQLMVEMRNNGTKPVTITQITAYAIAR
jgi:hypothetical protein